MRGFKIRMLLSRIEKTKQFDEEVSLLLTYLSERWETSRLRRSPGRSLQKEGIRRWIVEYHEANFEDDPNDLFQAPADRNASSLDSDKDSPSWSRPRMKLIPKGWKQAIIESRSYNSPSEWNEFRRAFKTSVGQEKAP